MKSVNLYTDGACSGNPGPGGWGCLLVYKNQQKQASGGEPETTNNRMELQAVIEGLKLLKESCSVHVYTDSKYVLDGFTKWLPGWKANSWRKSDKKPVQNAGLWQELDSEIKKHQVEWTWVKGHAGHAENELVDQLAREAIPKKEI